MPTFIDESGDPGASVGSSRFFRLAAVWFEHDDCMKEYLDVIENLKNNILGLPKTFEFRFAKNNNRQKAAFFNAIPHVRFNFAYCSLDKSMFEPRSLTTNSIRQATVEGLVEQMGRWYQCAEACKDGDAGLNERIVYDECDDPKYETILKSAFKTLSSGRGPDEKLIRSIKPGKSKADPRLQLVDMICGAVGSYLDGDDAFYKFFNHKEIGISRLPH